MPRQSVDNSERHSIFGILGFRPGKPGRPEEPGRAFSPRNSVGGGRLPGTNYPLLWNTVRTLLGKPNWGKKHKNIMFRKHF